MFKRWNSNGSLKEHSWFGLHQPFDPGYRLVTSGLVQPWVLFIIRLVIAIYTVIASIANLALYLGPDGLPGNTYYVFFTHLTFTGMTAYFCAAAFHTGSFVLSLRRLKNREKVSDEVPWYPLQKWGRILQFLHLSLFSTIITFPLIVTIVFWSFLSNKYTLASSNSAWSNITLHIFNTIFLGVELIFGHARLYPGYFLVTIVILALYLGMAYLVHSVQGIWIYGFLDPDKPGAHVAMFIVGVPIGQAIVYMVIYGLIHVRDWVFPRGRGVRIMDHEGVAMIP